MTPRLRTPGSIAAEVSRAAALPGAARKLFLDLDGTLAPIAPLPEDARVPPGVLAALDSLARAGWSVVVVSGRPAREAERMVPVVGVRVYGSHGLEGPERSDRAALLPAGIRHRLTALAASGALLATGTPGARVEVKPAGVAFHERAIPRTRLARWRREVLGLLLVSDLGGLEVIRGRRVVEVRPAGVHKGTVLWAETGAGPLASSDLSLVALGDDETDEDLFDALVGRGLSVLVGRGRRTSSAAWRLASPRAVETFLNRLARDVAGEDRRREP